MFASLTLVPLFCSLGRLVRKYGDVPVFSPPGCWVLSLFTATLQRPLDFGKLAPKEIDENMLICRIVKVLQMVDNPLSKLTLPSVTLLPIINN